MRLAELTGSRLRERRMALGLRQADVAQAAGVSASYLNLIEHNRRRVQGAVLARLALALGVDAATVEDGVATPLIDDLRGAAADAPDLAELDRIEDFAGRYPGWAGVLVAQYQRAGALERAVAALNDRMTHDPHLSASLHEVLSAVASVRSTAAILAETEDIDPDWRARFHRNLHQDSERLALGAEALVAYLDGSGQAEEQGIAAPQEELEAWLAATGWHLAALENGQPVDVGVLASGAARALAGAWVAQAAADVAALPLVAFRAALVADGPDPARLAARFGAPVLAVFRRLATLPGSPLGLVVCDASGTLIFRKPADGFGLPRFGASCPLWPLYAALARPMAPMVGVVQTPGRPGRRFGVQAFCQPQYPQGFAGPELRTAAMLILPDADVAGDAIPVGTTCRICPRGDCAARREPSIVTETP